LRKGYGTEVTEGLISFCFNKPEIQKIVSVVDSKNIGSIKILEKYFTKTRSEENKTDSSIEIKYELLKYNWESINEKRKKS
jgi:[ribosomal protein S5]-alanine N-acetyltransferase